VRRALDSRRATWSAPLLSDLKLSGGVSALRPRLPPAFAERSTRRLLGPLGSDVRSATLSADLNTAHPSTSLLRSPSDSGLDGSGPTLNVSLSLGGMSHRFIDMFAARAEALGMASAEQRRLAQRAAALDKTGSTEDEGCIFCDIVARREPGYIVFENEHAMAFLDSACRYGLVFELCGRREHAARSVDQQSGS